MAEDATLVKWGGGIGGRRPALPKLGGLGRGLMAFYGLIFVIIGIALSVLGFELLSLGGSAYYAIAGLLTIVAGLFFLAGDWRGGLVYAALLFGTLIWAFWENGLDFWGLVTRLLAPFLLGVPLLIGVLLAKWPGRRLAILTGVVVACLVAGLALVTFAERPETPLEQGLSGTATANVDWPFYGNGQGGSRFSRLAQITPSNAKELQLAWSTHVDQPQLDLIAPKFQVTPLKIGDLLYICTPLNDVLALDAATGRIRWRFDARSSGRNISAGACRGLAYYRVSASDEPCATRIYTGTLDARLIAIDARTGRACQGFGRAGQVDLLEQLGQKFRGYYSVTSPPQVVRGKLVVGGFVADGQYLGEPSGVIRAFDAVDGKLAWAWDMGRPDLRGAPPKEETYTLGTPNSWSLMSADEQLGLVYVPMGNATPDYYGAHRSPAMEKYSSSLVALDAGTGTVRWNFQFVHHDLWDYDVSVQPVLIDLALRGRTIPAVVQATKSGQIFVLDRRTGRPVFPVSERPVPQGAVAGDRVSPTQPFSSLPNVIGPRLQEADMWGLTPLDQAWCRIRFRQARYEGPFTPPGLKPTITQPGFTGGVEWGSTSYDPDRKLLLFVSNYIVNYNRLVPRGGMGGAPFKAATDPSTIDWSRYPQDGVPYVALTPPFLSPLQTPCTKPPFGRLNALDLSSGKIVWSRPLGTARSVGAFGIPSALPLAIGTPTFGGAITTAGGVTFVAAAMDNRIRAFETRTGRLLWIGELPNDGLATPMTYSTADGRQYVVIAVGDKPVAKARPAKQADGALPSGAGGSIFAFALPMK